MNIYIILTRFNTVIEGDLADNLGKTCFGSLTVIMYFLKYSWDPK